MKISKYFRLYYKSYSILNFYRIECIESSTIILGEKIYKVPEIIYIKYYIENKKEWNNLVNLYKIEYTTIAKIENYNSLNSKYLAIANNEYILIDSYFLHSYYEELL